MKFSISLLMLFTFLIISVAAQDDLSLYRDPDAPNEERVQDLLSQMTLEEKIGQMTLMEKGSISPDAVNTYFIGGVLSGGGGYPAGNNTPAGWAQMVHAYQDAALSTRLGIPMIYGVDAVHGHSNLIGAVIFPHNIGLGASRNPEIVQEASRITALEMIATGIYWNYAPVLAVPQDIRWGRTYEGYSENTELVTELSSAALKGLQGAGLGEGNSVLGTAKHFVGDGGTAYGSSPVDGGLLDRGLTDVDEATLRAVHLAPYIAAIENGARSVMISYSSWDNLRMHGQEYLIQDILRAELGFEGFIVSDWAGVDDVASNYYDAVVQSINAGIDMNMVPYDHIRFIDSVLKAVEKGDISMERIDEAVSNILQVKFEMGLFEHPYEDGSLQALVGSDEHRAVAREAVRESLVLLKNENSALPLDAAAEQTVFVAGQAADNLGTQSGGWTIEWQGVKSNVMPGTTILQGLEAGFNDNTTLEYSRNGVFKDASGNPAQADIGIVVVGEEPYAEWFGDRADLALAKNDRKLIEGMRGRVDTLIVVLLSGRPLVIDESLNLADAFVAAWLPGTEGNGVTDVLLGEHDFVGKLPYTWLRNMEQLPFDFTNVAQEGCEAPLFPYGYGLSYASDAQVSAPWLALAESCAPVREAVIAPTLSEVKIPKAPLLAPEGEFGVNYNAPFPVTITLDGSFADWAGVPLVTIPEGADLSSTDPAVSFGAAADHEFLYLYANVIDDNIISGEHGTDYWNEDSVEFYLNASGDFSVTAYQDGIAQLTIPALNIHQPETVVLSGVNGGSLGAKVVAVQTETGWAVEVALPLDNGFWMIEPAQDQQLGFQVHLNGAAETNRNTKLIWSLADTSDSSYHDPSVFGQLTFYEASAVSEVAEPVGVLREDGVIDDFESGLWLSENQGEFLGFAPLSQAPLTLLQVMKDSSLKLPEQEVLANNVLMILGGGGYLHRFTDGYKTVTQDWSAYNAMGMWLFGQGSGKEITLLAGEGSGTFLDAFTGWKYIIIPFKQLDGDINLSAVSQYGLLFPDKGIVDHVALFNVENTAAITVLDSVPKAAFVLDESITWDSREWELLWSDEFDLEAMSPINEAAWTCETGGEGWGNKELEFYTQSLENVAHDGNGNLVIRAKEGQPESDERCWYGSCAYTSARCITKDKVEFEFGRVEARLKIPTGKGVWPAFWMLGSNFESVSWPNSGEIDIMENIGSEPNTVYGTVHGPGYSGASGIGNSLIRDTAFTDDFHVYAVDWDPNVIRWYVDGELFGTVSLNEVGSREWAYNHEFFILLNLAIGGEWPGFPDESTEFPQELIVDYVRVYQLAGE